MSKPRLVVLVLLFGAAAFFAYQATALNQRALTTIGNNRGVALLTDEKDVLEMADALDELSKAGYSDGHGNRMTLGSGLRKSVAARRQKRVMYWSIAAGLGLIGGVVLVRGRRQSTADSTISLRS